MAINTMIELESCYHMTLFRKGRGRMAINTMIELESWYHMTLFRNGRDPGAIDIRYYDCLRNDRIYCAIAIECCGGIVSMGEKNVGEVPAACGARDGQINKKGENYEKEIGKYDAGSYHGIDAGCLR